ncbi:hypothetical protein FRB94_007186 [Tulasnella sp. JGI-2019a]|nr:hypothetical protein FRB94_007186 [Tulasnella sp. JGI-2019a]KAG9001964.1 hypothetical protein FRB93_011936 [Tulasnella sp. JGI-2019a]
MKDTFTDANFPRTAEGRVYHLGVRYGEVANRILTVGDPSRAKRVAQFLDAKPEPFTLLSDRGFLTITGTYQGIPVSIIAIGMGIANMDFFVRECRESVVGDMAIIRLGSCGGLLEDLPVGSLTVPRTAVAITRNYDYDFTAPEDDRMLSSSSVEDHPYRISRPVDGNRQLRESLVEFLDTTRDAQTKTAIVRGDVVNAACDGFYGSQGRKTSFPDHNEHLLEALMQRVPGVATLEMESHHLYHLASIYPSLPTPASKRMSAVSTPAILDREAGAYFILGTQPPAALSTLPTELSESPSRVTGGIYASSVHIIFAQRTSRDVITPEDAESRERWAGKACLETLKVFGIKNSHPDESSVWALAQG